jgi:hypothetical protein
MGCLCSVSASLSQPLPDALEWRRWEKSIASSVDFTAGGGNPYRDLTLRVRFRNTATGEEFIQDAFWDADSTVPRRFKVRTALPIGSWHWEVAGCTGVAGGQDCAAPTVTWAPASGDLNVVDAPASGIDLYERGFPTQFLFILADPVTRYGFAGITYADRSAPFFWMGDTAWAAPPREIHQEEAQWSSYLDDRKGKGFTAILLAPAVATKPKPGETWHGLPDAAGFSFLQAPGCPQGSPLPNDCSTPRKAYWDQFDLMVDQANAKDLTIVIGGLIDPTDLGVDGTYPALENARDFARYLAARLAGNAVIFSPGFDDKLTARTFGSQQTVKQVLDAVGPAIHQAAPRNLVTNHLAGGASCDDYERFRSAGWMSFFLFHSGHAFSQNGDPSSVCPGRLSGETQEQAALRRARQIPLTLRASLGSPSMPAINGEGPYDAFPVTDDPLDNPYRVRQAGYVSNLSNASGFTYGVNNLGIWDRPADLFDIDSSVVMQRLAARFRNRGFLAAHHEWIFNQSPDDSKKMVLASNASSMVLAYLPGDIDTKKIVIDTRGLPSLVCGRGWTMSWFDPTRNVVNDEDIVCTPSSDRIEIAKPQACTNSACDWVLEIQRTQNAEGTPNEAPPVEVVDPWTEISSADGTAGLYAATASQREKAAPMRLVVSPPGRAFVQSPRVAQLPGGSLIVWEASGLDGSLFGVFARRFDASGRSQGDEFRVNTTTEHDQRQPAVAADPRAGAVVVWSSFEQDGELGGIFGQRFDLSGKSIGGEFSINERFEGHQCEPQVAFDSRGGFIVAWSTDPGAALPGRIGFRQYDRNGRPLSGEQTILASSGRSAHLLDLHRSTEGFELRWAEEGAPGGRALQFLQRFDGTAVPLGARLQVLP